MDVVFTRTSTLYQLCVYGFIRLAQASCPQAGNNALIIILAMHGFSSQRTTNCDAKLDRLYDACYIHCTCNTTLVIHVN